MKKLGLILTLVVLLLVGGCIGSDPRIVTVIVTATPEPKSTAAPKPTVVWLEDSTTLTPTREPVIALVSTSDIENALRDAGFTREPYIDLSGIGGMEWKKGVWNAHITIWDNDSFTIRTLLDIGNPDATLVKMEEVFLSLDKVFSNEAMLELRENSRKYLDNNRTISGNPILSQVTGNEDEIVIAQFNKELSNFDSYSIVFTLDFWQVTCPPQYSYCSINYFPGTFTGETSFTFFRIDFYL